MGLDATTVFIVIVAVIVGYNVYSLNQVKNKVHCYFITPQLTLIKKWIKSMQRRVEFMGGWYYVHPKRVIGEDMSSGIHAFFPTKASALIFKWDSTQALDPRTFSNDYEKPEDRAGLDATEDIRGYSAGNVQAIAAKGKQTLLERLQPILIVVVVVIVGYMMYSMTKRMDMLGQALNVIQQQLMNIGK